MSKMMTRTSFISLILVAVGFIWGFAASYYHIFPFNVLRATVHSIKPSFATSFVGPKLLPDYQSFSDTKGRQIVDCAFDDPLVFLAIGQSNAANHLSTFGGTDPSARAYQFYDGRCYLIEDPVLGATGKRGSLWAEFAQSLSKVSGRPVVFITTAVGGSPLEFWLVHEGSYFQRTIEQMKLAREVDLSIDYVIWLQGEGDARRRTSFQAYANGLEMLIGRLDGEFERGSEPRWIIFQATICKDFLRSDQIILAAQKLVADNLARAIPGPNSDKLGARFRYDDCHFNADGKKAIIAELEEIVTRDLHRPITFPISNPLHHY